MESAWDRYVPGSIAIGEGRTRNGVHLVRGTFRFVRGLLAAISGYGGPDVVDRSRSSDYDPRREVEEKEERERARRREEDQLDRDWPSMFEPSPRLPPPATIN